jgi:hypothetical protein
MKKLVLRQVQYEVYKKFVIPHAELVEARIMSRERRDAEFRR